MTMTIEQLAPQSQKREITRAPLSSMLSWGDELLVRVMNCRVRVGVVCFNDSFDYSSSSHRQEGYIGIGITSDSCDSSVFHMQWSQDARHLNDQ